MNTENTQDGGPAFPCTEAWYNVEKSVYEPVGPSGMTLRDYFAAAALQGMIASGNDYDGSTEVNIATTEGARFAMAAYAFADAMLDARKKGAQ